MASCDSRDYTEVQELLNARLAKRGLPLLAVDGKLCVGPRSAGGFAGYTWNAVAWWLGYAGPASNMSPSTLKTLIERQPGAALAHLHAPNAVADMQAHLGVGVDGGMGTITMSALRVRVPGWEQMSSAEILAALRGEQSQNRFRGASDLLGGEENRFQGASGLLGRDQAAEPDRGPPPGPGGEAPAPDDNTDLLLLGLAAWAFLKN